jgi:hypothetical protein
MTMRIREVMPYNDGRMKLVFENGGEEMLATKKWVSEQTNAPCVDGYFVIYDDGTTACLSEEPEMPDDEDMVEHVTASHALGLMVQTLLVGGDNDEIVEVFNKHTDGYRLEAIPGQDDLFEMTYIP